MEFLLILKNKKSKIIAIIAIVFYIITLILAAQVDFAFMLGILPASLLFYLAYRIAVKEYVPEVVEQQEPVMEEEIDETDKFTEDKILEGNIEIRKEPQPEYQVQKEHTSYGVIPNSIKELSEKHFEVLKRCSHVPRNSEMTGIIQFYHNNIPALVKRFIELGLLTDNADGYEILSSLTINKLKEICKEHNIPKSGVKKDIIKRILNILPENEIQKYRNEGYLEYTPLGKELILKYKKYKKEEELHIAKMAIEDIMNGDISGASINLRGNRIDDYTLKICKHIMCIENYLPYQITRLNKFYNACKVYARITGASHNKAEKLFIELNPEDKDIFNEFISENGLSVYRKEREIVMQAEISSLSTSYYEVVAALDSKTCEYCGNYDGMVFRRSEAMIGTNCPPFHDGCRCTIVCSSSEIIEDETKVRWARDPRTGKGMYVSRNMLYPEFKEKYLDPLNLEVSDIEQ